MWLNFVEAIALYRAFSVGRFKCSGTTPKIIVADYQGEGYVLKIKKVSTKTICLECIKEFSKKRGLIVTEDKAYMTIQSS
ncbi:hypothetical protein G4O51_05860 [Candidatus Bathyarchaeota archaeon A05DMB-2]|jgi:hypothetical protein|nr:hypothetical protein [Candidatus Bathyarchaeota archaeon A05DMB-2]